LKNFPFGFNMVTYSAASIKIVRREESWFDTVVGITVC
jgi:hypothetical protein